MEDQDDLIIRKSECDELGQEVNAKAALEDVGYNADDHQYLQFYQFNFDTVLSSSSLIIQNIVIRSGVKIEFLKLKILMIKDG